MMKTFVLETEFANEFRVGSTQKPTEDKEVMDSNRVKQAELFLLKRLCFLIKHID